MSAFKGGKELQEFMDALPAKVEANLARAGLRAGARVMLLRLRQKLPVKSGKLKKSLRVSTRLKSGQATAKLSLGGKAAWYAGIVEFGQKAHALRAAKGKAIPVAPGVFRAAVQHPGSKGKGYVRATIDEAQSDAVNAVLQALRNRLRDKHGLDIPDPGDDAS